VKEISTPRKLQVAVTIIVSVLIIYAAGIVTNFFANPIFSMFFIISNETAHNIAIYVALVGAFVVAITGSAVILIKKRKTAKPQSPDKQIISSFETTNKTPISDNSLNMVQGSEESKNDVSIQETAQISEQPLTQKTAPSSTDQNVTNNQKTTSNKSDNEKITCPNCKKQFSKPSYMLDNSSSTPKLILLCPYCKQDINSKSRSVEEDDPFGKKVDDLHRVFGVES
jgi:hypothetical protein